MHRVALAPDPLADGAGWDFSVSIAATCCVARKMKSPKKEEEIHGVCWPRVSW